MLHQYPTEVILYSMSVLIIILGSKYIFYKYINIVKFIYYKVIKF